MPPSPKTRRNERLRALRLEKGWSVAELARRAGVAPQTAKKAEDGDAVTEVKQAQLAKALGVGTDEVFG